MRSAITIAIAVIVAVLAAGNVFANLGRNVAPAIAVYLGLTSARTNAAVAGKMLVAKLGSTGSQEQLKAAGDLARTALRSEPLNAVAMRALGLEADLRREDALAFRRMVMAERLNRRSTLTQLWLIEYHVRRGNMRAILKHYDNVLRTDPDTSTLLSPTLMMALSEPSVRDALRPYFTTPAPWLPGFLIFAAQNAQDPRHLLQLIKEQGGFPLGHQYDQAGTALLTALSAKNHFIQALELYRTLPGANTNQVRRIAFDETTTDPHFAPVTWEIARQPTLLVEFEAPSVGAMLQAHIQANEGSNGVALRKVLAFEPGTYRFRYQVSDIEADASSKASWRLTCPPKADAKLWPIRLSAGGRSQVEFVVPAGCPIQLLELNVSGGDRQSGLALAISLSRANLVQ